MSSIRHLLTVWNPSYSESAMDAHLEVLLGWAGREGMSGDERYVWWAKLRSPNRQQPLPHDAEVLAIQEQIDAGTETHLYLTDYRSLYVGHLEEVAAESPLERYPEEAEHMPAYYQGQQADFWFLLTDIRRLVADDTVAAIEELKRLRNTRYHGRPVSLYGGMVDLPLVVTRDDEPCWFADGGELTEGRLWAEREAELRGETGRMGHELRDNLIGRTVWTVLEPTTRNFLASAEAVFRARRDDPGFDFSGPAVGYAKAVETELNALLFPALHREMSGKAPSVRMVRLADRLVDLAGPVRHQTLGALRVLLEREETVQRGLRTALPHDGAWLVGELPYRLAVLEEVRNPAAHSRSAQRDDVLSARDMVLGIGSEGLVTRLALAKQRSESVGGTLISFQR